MAENKKEQKNTAVEPTEVKQKESSTNEEKSNSNGSNKVLLILLGVFAFMFFCICCCCVGFYAFGIFATDKGLDIYDKTLSEQCDELEKEYGDKTADLFWYCD